MKKPFRFAIAPASPLYVVMLGMLSALPPLGTDAGLPGLPSLQQTFLVDPASAAQTLTIFLFGFALGPVLFGPLSDQRGRKPVLLFGIALFALAGFGCAFADSIGWLHVCRGLQGIGAGAAAALPAAIVRDVFSGEQGRSRQSYVTLVNAVAPLVAPIIGAAFLAIGGWRAIYASIAAISALLFVICLVCYEETAPLPTGQTQAGPANGPLGNAPVGNPLRTALSRYSQLIANRDYLLATGIHASTFGTMFAYITASSSVFMTMLHASSNIFALLFAITAAGTICGAAVNARFSARLGEHRLFVGALTAASLLSLSLLLMATLGIRSIVITAACVVATNFCAGIIMPNATYRAMRNAAKVAGSAAALQRSLQMVSGAAAGAIFGMIAGDRLIVMAFVMSMFSLTALGLNWLSGKRQAQADAPVSPACGKRCR